MYFFSFFCASSTAERASQPGPGGDEVAKICFLSSPLLILAAGICRQVNEISTQLTRLPTMLAFLWITRLLITKLTSACLLASASIFVSCSCECPVRGLNPQQQTRPFAVLGQRKVSIEGQWFARRFHRWLELSSSSSSSASLLLLLLL